MLRFAVGVSIASLWWFQGITNSIQMDSISPTFATYWTAVSTPFNKQSPRLYKNNYAIWTFPFPPPSRTAERVDNDELLICHYQYACSHQEKETNNKKNAEEVERLNLRSLTDGLKFHHYVRDHAYHKVRHFQDFPLHIQAIAMISTLLKNPGTFWCVVCITCLVCIVSKMCVCV
jgi:hypothetical protein